MSFDKSPYFKPDLFYSKEVDEKNVSSTWEESASHILFGLLLTTYPLEETKQKAKTKTQSHMNLKHLHHSSLVQAPKQSTFLSQNQDSLTQARSTTRNFTHKQFLTNIYK